MYLLLQAGAVVLLIAIFGVTMATFALRHEKLERRRQAPELPDLAPAEPEPPPDPHQWLWWQDLQDLGYEIHLADGTVWRGNRHYPTWNQYPQGHGAGIGGRRDRLDAYHQQIRWASPEAKSKHAHCLLDWSALERAYQLALLNGSVWQFNVKSEGLGKNNEMAWHLISSPEGIVYESLDSVHRSLNAHLKQIREQEAALLNWAPGGAGGAGGVAQQIANNRLLLHQVQAMIQSNQCSSCQLSPVSIPGGICRYCREAQGAV